MPVGRRVLLIGALLVASAAVAPAAAWSRAAAAPCTTNFHRVAGKRLAMSLTCQQANVMILLVEFPGQVIRAGTRFQAGGCHATTPSTWYCLFPSGVPLATPMNGSVTFAASIPHGLQHAHVIFYPQDNGGGAYVGPGTELVGAPVTVLAGY